MIELIIGFILAYIKKTSQTTATQTREFKGRTSGDFAVPFLVDGLGVVDHAGTTREFIARAKQHVAVAFLTKE